MVKQPEGAPSRYRRTSPQGDYARFWDEHHLPCQQPPWGELKAIDVNTGKIAWSSTLGITEGIAEKTGAPNIGGSIATAGGVVFIGGTNDSRFRAFDSATGAELWMAKLEASGHATPITYRGKSGRQYVVIAAGGGGFFSATGADVVAAYALPEKSENE
jgi:quinoprotein glucose dehydrogenase